MTGRGVIRVAIIGNPNSGKTCLFNNLTGAHQHVGNWPGVTVEKKTGNYVYQGHIYEVIDLPGCYHLVPYSLEEEVVERFLYEEPPDVLINIVDATNLERHLLLTAQLVGLGVPMVLALNMMDEAGQRGITIDVGKLEQMLGIPVVPMVARRNKGTMELLERIASLVERPHVGAAGVDYGILVEGALERLEGELEACSCRVPLRQRALSLLRGRVVCGEDREKLTLATRLREQLEESLQDRLESYILERCYGFAHGVVRMCVVQGSHKRLSLTDRLDNYLTHPVLGLIVFAASMWITFEVVFAAGEPLTTLLESGFERVREGLMEVIPAGFWRSLVTDGVVRGVGGVLTFLPNVLLLFLAIGILEDSGYMARAAFVMDGIMHRLGLHGKSFIPMLIGFGCTVPAVMATRALDTRRDRLITALILPFMSCGARVPVYALFISAFFSARWHATVVMSLYLLGIVVAIGSANVLGRLFFMRDYTPLLMELPPYRLPSLRSVGMLIWQRAWMYLKKAGTLLLAASIMMWYLCSYPRPARGEEGVERDGARVAFEATYAARLGRALEPLVRPLGFDWRIAVGLLSGVAAKEAVVATLLVVYGVSDEDGSSAALEDKLRMDPLFSGKPWVAYTLLVFVLLYVPCVAVMVVFFREFGIWWTVFMTVYTTLVAWVVAWCVRVVGWLCGASV
ncbi:MAG: ferrous iron transport protein B [bacterium]|nr:ferrous iron transport protein B [bacterium]